MVRSVREWHGFLLALAVIVLLAGCGGDTGTRQEESVAPTPSSSAAGEVEPDRAEPTEPPAEPVTLAFAGDVHFEGGVASLLDDRGATVGPLSEALRTADVAVVNLESALTSGGSPTSKELEDPSRRYWFRSPPSALALLQRSGVDAVSLANNHGADYGAEGLRDSLGAAETSPLGVIGVGNDAAQAFSPYRTSVDGTDIAVLAADASPLESNNSIWNVGSRGPGLAAARDDTRLLAAVRQADRTNDVVAVYLHWGAENVGCPTSGQQELAQAVADAGADIIVGSHAHVLLGAGMLDDTYVSYGLGNFLWYHGSQASTGVLRVQIADGKVIGDEWVPGEIPQAGGQPRLLSGDDRTEAIRDWRALRGCTALGPAPRAPAPADDAEAGAGTADGEGEVWPAYASSIRALPAAVRDRMTGSSHEPATCPVELADLRLLSMGYVDFDGASRTGTMIVHRDHAEDVVKVFGELYTQRFPIRRMQLVDAYGGDDNRSMAADNSSAYNCRTVEGQSTYSEHAYGAAVDINPVENPYVVGDQVLPPAGIRFVDTDRSAGADAGRGVIVADDVVVRAFARIGWEWGGVWNDPDYQHFSAP